MELRARIRPFSRRAALMAALVALLASALAGRRSFRARREEAKAPVITSVVTEGRRRRRDADDPRPPLPRAAANKNTVVFKRDGARAVFVKASVGTREDAAA